MTIPYLYLILFELIRPDLKSRLADIFLTIGNSHTFHLEAQMTQDNQIFLRVFEYGFYYAMSAQETPDCLNFPEPVIIYLNRQEPLPEESILHISFGSQGTFDYRIRNYSCLAHDVTQLNQQNMAVLIPFQVLRLHNFLDAQNLSENENSNFSPEAFFRLQEEIQNDIIRSIEMNFQLGNLTLDDASQLLELSNQLHEHICSDFHRITKGAVKHMKPLLPGALELPNDKYRFRIDELEKEISRYADENARYADENARLKKRISELKHRQLPI